MNTLYSLTYRNLKMNKKRTIVTMIGIILSVALICAVAGMVTSLQQSLINSEIESSGNYHVTFENVPLEEANVIRQHREVAYSFSFGEIGYARISENPEEIVQKETPYIRLVGFDKETIDNYPMTLKSGRLPENSNEILISAAFVDTYHWKVGDTVTLAVGTRTDKDGNILTEEDELVTEECDEYGYCSELQTKDYLEEKIENATTKEYKVVGILEYYYYSYSYYPVSYKVYTMLDSYENIKSLDLYLRYKDPKKYKDLNAELNPSWVDEEGHKHYTYDYSNNEYLLDLLGVGFSDNTMKVLYTIMAIVIGIIMVSSIFVIKNGFSISIVERYKQFGMLSSVGATSKQIRRSTLFEGFLLGVIAIPIGILSGIFADFVLVNLVNYIIKDFVDSAIFSFHITYLPILVAVIASSVTIFLSCLIPAVKASRLSILELIRGNNSIKIKAKKLKTPKYITKLFGIGGEIADKNLKRNKKKYRTTVVSIVVSIVIFISLYYFMNLVFDTSTFYYSQGDYDFQVGYYTNEFKEYDSTTREKMEKIKDKILTFGSQTQYSFEKSLIFESADSSIWNQKALDYDPYQNKNSIQLLSVGQEEYERLIKKIGGKVEDYKDGAILIDDFVYYDMDDKKYYDLNFLDGIKDGDTLELTYSNYDDKEEKHSIKVIKRTDEKVLSMSKHLEVYNWPVLIVSEDYFFELAQGKDCYGFSIYLKTEDTDSFEKEIDLLAEEMDENSHIYYDNIREYIREQRAMVLIISIFLYGFITVITLIGVTNIFNTITTNMALRSREFAMLKAIGMTNKEFNRMIRLESILYGLKSLIIGIPIGVLLSYFIHRALSNALVTPYQLPITAILISILFVFIIVYMTMRYSLSKINKQNIIETIREENI